MRMAESRIAVIKELDYILPKPKEEGICPCTFNRDDKRCPFCARKVLRAFRKKADIKPVYRLLNLKKEDWKNIGKQVRDIITEGIRGIQKYKADSISIMKEVAAEKFRKLLMPPIILDHHIPEVTPDFDVSVIEQQVERNQRTQDFIKKSFELIFVCDKLPDHAKQEVTDLLTKMFN